VSAHRCPRWTASEVVALREVYPAGGLAAAVGRLSGRSWRSIYVKASKLGLKCGKAPDAPKCRLAGERLEQAISRRADGWSFARIGAHLGLSESAVCNAVLNALCSRNGHTPAERHPNGRLTERGMERLRWCLKKGMKGVEIQLRLGVTASCVAEQRRRYNSELRANGKALLPPPGGGAAYSGARVQPAKKREAERLFLDGYGTKKVSEMTGVSKTVCTRIRGKLIRKLKREGKPLAGCDERGIRRRMRDHARHVPAELRDHLRGLILERMPVRRAAAICGIGSCTAYRIRDELKAELGELPSPKLPGRVSKLRSEMLYAQAIPAEHLWRFRDLVREHGEAEARRVLRSEMAEIRRNETFEQKLQRVDLKIAPAFKPSRQAYEHSLGGVTDFGTAA
jgi:hypothetical protein